MKLNSDYSLELIDDEYVLIHSSADEVDFSKVITFNEVGAFIFNKIKEGKTKEEILDELVKTDAFLLKASMKQDAVNCLKEKLDEIK